MHVPGDGAVWVQQRAVEVVDIVADVLAQVEAGIELPWPRPARTDDGAVIARLRTGIDDDLTGRRRPRRLLGDDVDHGRRVGMVLGAGIGDDLDARHGIGRHGLQGRRQVIAAKRG